MPPVSGDNPRLRRLLDALLPLPLPHRMEVDPSTVPYKPREPADSPVPREPILVVDDVLVVAVMVADTLQLAGYTVELASNGLIALEKLRQRTYCLIVSNMCMPALDGLGLFRAVQQQYPHLAQHFIFITGHMLGPGTQRALAAVRVPCIKKPFKLEELLIRVRAMLAVP